MARERYLLGAEEDTIHSGAIVPTTAKEKRANWWFYHKGPLLVTLLLAAALVSIVYSVVSQVEPDYTIALITSYNMPDEARAQMEAHMARYGQDRNGDGKVVVQLNNYVFVSDMKTTTDFQAIQANMTRFAGDTALNECMIYFHDEAGFDSVRENFPGFFQYNNGDPMPEDAADYENAMRSWDELRAFDDFQPEMSGVNNWTPEILLKLCSRLRYSLRTQEGSSFAEDQEKMAYYQDCLALMDRLQKGEMPQPQAAKE